MKKAIINGKIFFEGKFQEKHIIIDDEKISEITSNLPEGIDILFDAKGKHVSPGFIDVHVHLREPGFTHKETIKTGSEAAAAGGYTQICAMPNTQPVMDNAQLVKEFYDTVRRDSKIKVYTYAAITHSLNSEELVDFKALKEAGAFAFTNDGLGVQTSSVMYEAMQEAGKLGMAVVAHCEDNSLIYGGSLHQGKTSEKLGVAGIPNICESVQIARDVLLAEAAHCHYHVCHLSAKESVRAVRDAKRAEIWVTSEVTPHHLLLNEEDITDKNPNFKMNPPLRSKEDQQALIQGLLDGTIDCIATDHAPHSEEEKSRPLEKAPFGIIGSEHAFSLLYTELVKKGICTLEQLIEWITLKPAQVFGMQGGKIEANQPADFAILDLDASYIIEKPFVSKSSNTPFLGRKVQGTVTATIVNGKIIYQRN